MMTSEQCKNQSKYQLYLEASPAKILALQEKEQELKEAVADCGLKCLEWWGELDLNTSSLKTVQQSLFEDLNECYATFPKSGMMQNGKVYRASPLEYNRVGNEHISLPTPRTLMHIGCVSIKRFFGSSTYKGNLEEYLRDGEQDGKYPNQELLEQLMTFPIGWSELKELETQ